LRIKWRLRKFYSLLCFSLLLIFLILPAYFIWSFKPALGIAWSLFFFFLYLYCYVFARKKEAPQGFRLEVQGTPFGDWWTSNTGVRGK
jgi:hypothetical protein